MKNVASFVSCVSNHKKGFLAAILIGILPINAGCGGKSAGKGAVDVPAPRASAFIRSDTIALPSCPSVIIKLGSH